MATTKRVSKKVVQNVTQAEFETALAAYASADAKALQITAKMDVEITKIRDKYAPELNGLMETCETNQEVLQVYCTENKEKLFESKKSIDTAHGTLGFRTGTPKLKLLPKFNWGKVLEHLKSYLPDYVRTIEEPAKDRILIDRETEIVSQNLKKVGLEVVQDESFFIALKKEEVTIA